MPIQITPGYGRRNVREQADDRSRLTGLSAAVIHPFGTRAATNLETVVRAQVAAVFSDRSPDVAPVGEVGSPAAIASI
jgi:hypothetical protein